MSTQKSNPTPVEMINVDDRLTPKQSAFCREYLVDYNGTQAAIRAGYAENSAQEQSSRLLSNAMVMATIARRQAAAADAAEVDSALVISELYQLAMADPRELMRVETDCCRHCYGIFHLYQWTPAEFHRAVNEAQAGGKQIPELAGGFGYDPRRTPVDSCPECFGRGVDRVVVTPSKKLSKGAARLLSTMKATKDGIEIKVHDAQAALMALGKITGAIRDRTELTGPGGGPIQLQPQVAPNFRTMSTEELRLFLKERGHNPPLLEAKITPPGEPL